MFAIVEIVLIAKYFYYNFAINKLNCGEYVFNGDKKRWGTAAEQKAAVVPVL